MKLQTGNRSKEKENSRMKDRNKEEIIRYTPIQATFSTSLDRVKGNTNKTTFKIGNKDVIYIKVKFKKKLNLRFSYVEICHTHGSYHLVFIKSFQMYPRQQYR